MKTNLIGLMCVVLLALVAMVACAQQRGGDYFQSNVNLPGFHREVIETPQAKVVVNYNNNTAIVNGQPARLVVVQPVQPVYNRYNNGYPSGPYYPATFVATSRSRQVYDSKHSRNGFRVRQSGVYDYSYGANDPNTLRSYGSSGNGRYDYYHTAKFDKSGAYYDATIVNQRETMVTWNTGSAVYGEEIRTYNTGGSFNAGFYRPSGMTRPGWHPHELDMIYRR